MHTIAFFDAGNGNGLFIVIILVPALIIISLITLVVFLLTSFFSEGLEKPGENSHISLPIDYKIGIESEKHKTNNSFIAIVVFFIIILSYYILLNFG